MEENNNITPKKNSKKKIIIISIITSLATTLITVFLWEVFLGEYAQMMHLKNKLEKIEVDVEDLNKKTKHIRVN